MAKENWKPMNLIRENLVMTSTYALKTVRTDAEGRGKKLSRVRKMATNGAALVMFLVLD